MAAADWSGQDWALALGGAGVLATALLTGVGSFVTSMVTLHRVGQVAKKVDGMLEQRDAAKFDAGERKGVQAGVETAAVLAQGQKEGREAERERQHHPNGEQPLPVKDDQAAEIAMRNTVATERIADAAEDKK